ncbi:metal ABC transporter solute-binding protein, Zn/Mn family [Prosthecomicrobium sp. N25]|uniref:metal ABC transporter solute-binding protein, Zn/Mn family n=1 Tax=Prosthecomicrobium sp. N25 TaxID=3129254 RepID=UPI003078726D
MPSLSRRDMIRLAILAAAGMPAPAHAEPRRLKIGITLHPYYSFVANVVGDGADIVPIVPAEANPHGYQPQPEDIKRTMSLDVLVVNGIGHDEWVFKIVEAAGRKDSLPLVWANASVALIPIGGDTGPEKVVNPHTFISTTAAIQQVYEIARRLGEIDTGAAARYRSAARDYAARIRKLRADFMQRAAGLSKAGFRAATMHAGYDYLFQELGLRIAAVVEPRHGVNPTARQFAQTLADIRAADVNVLFAEKYFGESALAETVQRETGVKVFTLSHITDGPFTADKFEVEMAENLATVERAIRAVAS